MFIVVFENTLLLPRSGAEAEKGELYWSAARKICSIFKTSRRCDHMMILWWLYNDHMIINDHMMIVSSEVTQPEIGAGFYPGSLALESTILGFPRESGVEVQGSGFWGFVAVQRPRFLGWRFLGVHMQLKFKFTCSSSSSQTQESETFFSRHCLHRWWGKQPRYSSHTPRWLSEK